MNNVISFSIYTTQAILAIVVIQGMLYRLIAIDFRTRLIRNENFFEIIQALNQGTRWEHLPMLTGDKYLLGWLFDLKRIDSSKASAAIESENYRCQAYIGVFGLVSVLAPLSGLLGTVAGFIVSKNIDDASLSLAFLTTFWGIVISVPSAVYLALTDARRRRLQFQFETLLSAIVQAPGQLAVPRNARNDQVLVPPPIHQSAKTSIRKTQRPRVDEVVVPKHRDNATALAFLEHDPLPATVDQCVSHISDDCEFVKGIS